MALVRLNGNVDKEQATELKHALVDEGISFSEWLRIMIHKYLFEREPKRRRRTKKAELKQPVRKWTPRRGEGRDGRL